MGPRNTTVFVGSSTPLELGDIGEWTSRPGVFTGHVLTAENFADLRARNGECVLTDDWAPVENLLAPVVKADRIGLWSAALNAGIHAAEKKDYPRAVRYFQQALEISPDDEDALSNLAHVQELAGNETGALDAYAAIIQLYPENVSARNRAAMMLVKQGHVGPALEQWGASLKINPAQPEVLNNLGAVAMQEGHREEAVRYWRQALEFAPGTPILLQNLAAAQGYGKPE